MKKVILFSFLLGFFAFHGWATHSKGGEITYKHISGFTYEIRAITYTNKGAPVDRDSIRINNQNIVRDTIIRIDSCTQRNEYVTTQAFPGAGNYCISIEDPNRNAGIKNLPNSATIPFYVESCLFITDPQFIGHNSSVYFGDVPIMVAQTGTIFRHNPAAIDTDGDRLSFELVNCRGSGGINISGYKFPDDTSFSNGSLEINPISGEITWKYPVDVGLYNIAVRVEEYRWGFQIGSVIRDFQIRVIDQYHSSNTFAETSTWDTNSTGDYAYSVNPGDSLRLSFAYHDSATDTRILRSYSEAYLIINPATFSSNPDTGQVEGVFIWQPDSSHVRGHPYIVTFRGISMDTGQIEDCFRKVETDITLLIYVGVPVPEPLSIKESSDYSNSTVIFPNPFNTSATIQVIKPWNNDGGIASLSLYDLQGRELRQVSPTSDVKEDQITFKIDRGDLVSGMYFYQILGVKGIMGSGKFIVE